MTVATRVCTAHHLLPRLVALGSHHALRKAGLAVATSPTSVPEILLATDFGELAHRALACAKQMALLRGFPVHALHVIDLMGTATQTYSSFAAARDDSQRGLRRIQHELRVAGLRGSSTLVTAGSAPHAIHDAMLRYKASMLVLGLHGEISMLAATIGTSVKTLLRRAEYPVMTVGAGFPEPLSGLFERPLFVTDTLPESLRRAVDFRMPGQAPAPLIVIQPNDDAVNPANGEEYSAFSKVSRISFAAAAESLRRDLAAFIPTVAVVSLRAREYLDVLTPKSPLHTMLTRAPCPVLTLRASH